jgi:membrane-associated phospholipid phosphatase
MTLKARLVWLVALLATHLLYVPINRLVQGGVVLQTPLDAWIPFWPAWALPYLLGIAWWWGCFIWAAWKMDEVRYRAFVVGAIATMLSSYAVYLLYPTYVERPALEGHGWPVELMRFIYNADRLNNAFPSSHAYTTMLIVLFWWSWRPHLRGAWVAIAVIILLSTLFTRQHNLVDPLGGILWAWMGYRLGSWWAVRKVSK